MAIKSFMLIDLTEFKEWKGFDNTMANTVGYGDDYITEAIIRISTLFDSICKNKFTHNNKWGMLSISDHPEDQRIVDRVKEACAIQVQYQLRKGVEYNNEQSSSSTIGGVSFSTSYSNESLFIVPEALMILKSVGFYENFDTIDLNKRVDYNQGVLEPSEIFADGQSRCYTIQESDSKYMWKKGSIVSLSNTIKITDLRNYENTGQWSIDIENEVIEGIATQIFLILKPKLPKEIVDLPDFQKLVKDYIKAYINDDEKLKESIALLVEEFLENSDKFLSVVEKAVEGLLAKDSEFKKDLGNDKDFIGIIVQNITGGNNLEEYINSIVEKYLKENIEPKINDMIYNYQKNVKLKWN